MSEKKQEELWPMTDFHFKVQFSNDISGTFLEVSGLEQVTESLAFQTIRPNMLQSNNVSLKRGMLKRSSAALEYLNGLNTMKFSRREINIYLSDAEGNTQMSWTLSNAFPCKVETDDLHNEGKDVIAIEKLELTYEKLSIATPS